MLPEAVRDKLKWTSHHFDILDKAVTEYIDPKNILFAPKRSNDAKTLAWGHLDSKFGGAAATVISHMFGDVLQSANSCLDYLVCELFLRHHPEEVAMACHKFPLVTSHSAFNEKLGGNALYGIPFEAIAVIEGLQPYKGRTDPVPADLLALRTLANIHKHRKIHIAVLTANPAPSNSVPVEIDGEFSVRIGDLPKATHYKAEIGPFPITDNGEVNMNRHCCPAISQTESVG